MKLAVTCVSAAPPLTRNTQLHSTCAERCLCQDTKTCLASAVLEHHDCIYRHEWHSGTRLRDLTRGLL